MNLTTCDIGITTVKAENCDDEGLAFWTITLFFIFAVLNLVLGVTSVFLEYNKTDSGKRYFKVVFNFWRVFTIISSLVLLIMNVILDGTAVGEKTERFYVWVYIGVTPIAVLVWSLNRWQTAKNKAAAANKVETGRGSYRAARFDIA